MASIFTWFKKRNSLHEVSGHRKKSTNKSQKEIPSRSNSSKEKGSKQANFNTRRSVSVPNEPNFSRMSFQLNGVQRSLDNQKSNRTVENKYSNFHSNGNLTSRNFFGVQVKSERSETRFSVSKSQRQSRTSPAGKDLVAEPKQLVYADSFPSPVHRYSVPNGFVHHQRQEGGRRYSDTMQVYVPRAISHTSASAVLFGIKHDSAPVSKESLLMSRSANFRLLESGRYSHSRDSNRKSSDLISYHRPAVMPRHSMYEDRVVTRLFDNLKTPPGPLTSDSLTSDPIGLVQSNVDGNFYFTSSLLGDLFDRDRRRRTELTDDDVKAPTTVGNMNQLSSEVRGQDSNGYVEFNNKRNISLNDNEIKDAKNNNCNVNDGSSDSDDVNDGSLDSDDVNDGSLDSDDVTDRSLINDDVTGGSFSNDEDMDDDVASALRQYDEIVASVSED